MGNMKKTFASFFFIIVAISVCAYAFASYISVSGSHIVLMMDAKAIASFVAIAVAMILAGFIKHKLTQK